MDILIYLLTGILVICCILLTLIVLIQRPRSEGLGAAFGGGMTESMFGAGTSDILTKATIWMAGAFFVCTLLLAILMSHRQSSSSSVLESALETNPEAAVESIESESSGSVSETTDSASAPEKAE